jgi:hypothetical protein
MAVKPEVIKARLKVLFPKANLSQKRLDAIAAKLAPMPADDADDAAVDAVVNQANDFNSFDEIAREDDRVRTLEEKAKPPTPPTPPGPTDPPTPPAPPADAPEWVKAMMETNKALLEKVTAIETGNVLQSKKQTASQLFEKSDVLKGLKEDLKPRWINRIDVNSETSIEDQVKELETEYSELVQVSADSNQYGGPAGGGSTATKPDDAVVNSIVENLNI